MVKPPEGVTLPPRTRDMLLSFVLTGVFGLIGIPSIFNFRDTIPVALVFLTNTKYTINAFTMFTAIVLGSIWLILFFVLWHKLEKDQSTKARLMRAARWIGLAIVVFLLSMGSGLLLDLYATSMA